MDLPVIIHTREAEDDTLAILREESRGALRGVLHCFTGTERLAEEALGAGITHLVCRHRHLSESDGAARHRAVVPADRLLCETDSPYLAPTPYRGKRNEPAWVARVVEELAMLRGVGTVAAAGADRRQFFGAVSSVNL